VSFADELKAARIERGLTQSEVAEVLGSGESTVGNWETGKNAPSFENIEKLEQFFGVRFNVTPPQDVPDSNGATAEGPKDKAPTPRKPAAKKSTGTRGMPPLTVQLEMPYKLGATALRTRLPYTAAALDAQAGPCAQAWDQFLMRYPKLREKIEQGAVAADIVNLVYAHLPIVTTAREEIAAQQMANFPADVNAPAA
jgi:transcriptional regulator with XRE-family HTH domain